MRKRAVFGAPGTGKTTRLLTLVGQWVEQGVPPKEIAFVAFTRQAAYEARARAMTMLGLTEEKSLPYFRTLHSMAYRELGMDRSEVMQPADWKELSALLNLPLSGTDDADPWEGPGVVQGAARAAKVRAIMTIIHYHRAKGVSLDWAWRQHGQGVDWHELELVERTIRTYKQDTGKHDFADMLDLYHREGPPLPVRYGVVDEAQDLSPVQWSVARRALREADEVVVGGDDDQSIYQWAGADVEEFLYEAGVSQVEVLERSHRLPRAVYDFATDILRRVRGPRQPKHWGPDDRPGAVEWLARRDQLDMREGEWLVLGRNGWHLRNIVTQARLEGVPYVVQGRQGCRPHHVQAIVTWERLRAGKRVRAEDARAAADFTPGLQVPQGWDKDERVRWQDLPAVPEPRIWHEALAALPVDDREYYRAVLQRGERLQDPPRVRIDTIHGSKGAEADNVALLTDMTRRSYQGYRLDPDAEHRVYYVGATRARERLVVLAPTCPRHYEIG